MDLSGLAEWHRARRSLLSLALYEVEDPTRAGIVELSVDGRVRRFVEKPRPAESFSRLASAGILVAEPEVLGAILHNTFCDFGLHLTPGLLERAAPIYGRPANSYVLDIGSTARYRQAEVDARRVASGLPIGGRRLACHAGPQRTVEPSWPPAPPGCTQSARAPISQ